MPIYIGAYRYCYLSYFLPTTNECALSSFSYLPHKITSSHVVRLWSLSKKCNLEYHNSSACFSCSLGCILLMAPWWCRFYHRVEFAETSSNSSPSSKSMLYFRHPLSSSLECLPASSQLRLLCLSGSSLIPRAPMSLPPGLKTPKYPEFWSLRIFPSTLSAAVRVINSLAIQPFPVIYTAFFTPTLSVQNLFSQTMSLLLWHAMRVLHSFCFYIPYSSFGRFSKREDCYNTL